MRESPIRLSTLSGEVGVGGVVYACVCDRCNVPGYVLAVWAFCSRRAQNRNGKMLRLSLWVATFAFALFMRIRR
jgi:hypothetical protein